MVLLDNKLWVADIDELVCIEVNTGEVVKKITVPNAGLLNDLTSDNMGAIYISDTDSNAIYKLENDSITLISNQGLSAPNGLLFDSGRLLLASMGSTDFAAVDIETGVKCVIATGVNKGDGIAKINKNEYIVSDWFGEFFLINPDSTKQSLLKTSELKIYAADIDYIASKKLLLVPTFFNNKIMAYKLE